MKSSIYDNNYTLFGFRTGYEQKYDTKHKYSRVM